jgi:hypothetical protein
MRAWLTLVSLLLVDSAVCGSVTRLREAVRVSSEVDLPLAAELAFAVGGIVLLVGIPLVGWRVLVRAEDALPRARVVRYRRRAWPLFGAREPGGRCEGPSTYSTVSSHDKLSNAIRLSRSPNTPGHSSRHALATSFETPPLQLA